MSNPFTPGENAAPAAPAAPAGQSAPASANQFAGPTFDTVGDPAALFGAARSGGQHKLKDDMGCFVVIRVLEFIEGMQTQVGNNDAIRADWVPVNGPDAGIVRENGMIFGRALVPAMKSNFENGIPFTIGVVAEGEAKQGQSAPIILNEPNDEQAGWAVEVASFLGWIK